MLRLMRFPVLTGLGLGLVVLTCMPVVGAEVDFEGLPEGYILDGQDLYEGHGISGAVSGVVRVSGAPNPAIVFASDCPDDGTPDDCSGNDSDLGTPNECNGGPGVDKDLGDGRGGECGATLPDHPFPSTENDTPLGNVAIVAEDLGDGDGDGNVDDPDDADVAGLYIEFDFTDLNKKKGGVTVNSLTYLDNDEGEDNAMVFFWGPGTLNPSSFGLDALGDNGVLTLTPGIAGVDVMQVLLDGSGAVTSVVFEEEIERPCWVTLGGFNKDSGTVNDPSGQKYCTFGGNVGPPPSGSFEVNWHDTGDPDLDGSKFHTNTIEVDHCEDLTDGPGQPGAKNKGLLDDTLFFDCGDSKFNGEWGYSCVGFFQDNGEPQGKKGKLHDTICLEVWGPGGFVASCGPGCDAEDGYSGTDLIGGNVQIHPCLGSQCVPK